MDLNPAAGADGTCAKGDEMSTLQKRKLNLANVDEVTAEVRRLQKGYHRMGEWSLPQVCWHLNEVMTRTMLTKAVGAVEVKPEARAMLKKILEEGEMPRVEAPGQVVPPADAEGLEVERFLETLERLRKFKGPFAPHRFFGEMGVEDYTRLHLIHCAHHLGYLVPMGVVVENFQHLGVRPAPHEEVPAGGR
jgi:hypothetical protein